MIKSRMHADIFIYREQRWSSVRGQGSGPEKHNRLEWRCSNPGASVCQLRLQGYEITQRAQVNTHTPKKNPRESPSPAKHPHSNALWSSAPGNPLALCSSAQQQLKHRCVISIIPILSPKLCLSEQSLGLLHIYF